ncbi:lipopolysaccharide assembly protein LapB [Paraburkholderia sp. DHOC27]|uniref:tetratricopeptide repeat protein n=1 Tax=Paraburkholderia sp. DHOC27 TaxID=2303330 RepID=UPI000E3C82E4|nr:pilus assembly protein [Paraburkholderia sp. DHOC27]RFU48240.1 pilus assembly protein [Paraburkholderia sp. DHOC27]
MQRAGVLLMLATLGACAMPSGYGVGAQAERAAEIQQATRDPAPDAPGTYLDLINRMQAQGLYYASLAHIDAYEKQYGVTPDTIVLRADALRMTQQPAAAAQSYTKLLQTPLAARGHRGLGLIAGAAGDFARAADELQQAAQLAPTDALTLSDLGYARLREGNIAGARVPLMKAAELDQSNPKIISNIALYLLASGEEKPAAALMEQQKFTPDVRAAIRGDAHKVTVAGHTYQHAAQMQQLQQSQQSQQDPRAAPPMAAPVAMSGQTFDAAPRLLQRFAQ